MYVWFDALVNYISTLGWPKTRQPLLSIGLAQIAGKDNLRQQAAMAASDANGSQATTFDKF